MAIELNTSITQIPGIHLKQEVCTIPTPSKFFPAQRKQQILAPSHIRSMLKNYPTFQTGAKQCALITQTHSDHCAVIHYPRLLTRADASTTERSQIALSIYTADCLPIIISATNAQSIAAIHAGWRGLYQNIIAKTVNKIPVPGDKLIAWIGPSISQKHYEVSLSFKKMFTLKFPYAEVFFKQYEETITFDGKGFAVKQLQICGIKQIDLCNTCTFASPDLPSWRESKGQTQARIWTHIWKA